MKQPHSPTIRANILASIAEELRTRRMPVDRLLRKHIGDAVLLRDPYEQIPLARFVAFLEEAADASGDPLLGAKLGDQQKPEEFGPIGLMFLASPNLRVAMTRLSAFYSVWQGGTRLELDVRCELPECIYQILDPSIWPRRQDAELSLASICANIRALLGPRWRPIEVHLEHERPVGQARLIDVALERVFRAPVLFGRPLNRIILDPRDLKRPVAARGAAIVPYLERHLMDLMRAEQTSFHSFAAQVSHIISKRLGRGSLDMHTIALEVGLSARTLQRRLAAEGTSLRDLVRQHRSRAVDRLLKDGRTKMTVIAHDMGYADAATFSRAFKRWRGESPRDLRGR